MSPYIILGAFGLLMGSFLNVCIHRLPKGESVVKPASRCPSCGSPIRPWDNIPILSYVFLRGKCRKCGVAISPRYPLVEALNCVLYLGVFYRFGIGWHLPFYLALVSSLIALTFIDLDHQIIPDEITLPGIPIGLIAGALFVQDPFLRGNLLGLKASAIGSAAGFGLFYLVAVLSRGGMGGGDIKLMAMLGAFMGWKSVLLTTFAGSLLGSVLGIFLMAFKGKGRKTKIPFGPFLAAGALITLFWGQEILIAYLNARR